jgi:hypothetical protein
MHLHRIPGDVRIEQSQSRGIARLFMPLVLNFSSETAQTLHRQQRNLQMRNFGRIVAILGLIGIGYVLGSVHGLADRFLLAQDKGTLVSAETTEKIKVARDAADASMTALIKENAYVPAIEGLNAFAATTAGTGGINAIEDLKSGRGVDPETFAGLYAGLAVNDVASKLTRDTEGRLLYEDKLVRMYPISRMKQLFQGRASAPETKDGKAAPKADGEEKKK